MTNETLLAMILGFNETDEAFKNFTTALLAAVKVGDPEAKKLARVVMDEVEIVKATAYLTEDKDTTVAAMRAAKFNITSAMLDVL